MILSSMPWWSCLVASAAYAVVLFWPSSGQGALATRMLPVAWGLHAISLILGLVDWTGHAPMARFGFALSLSMMLWCVVGVYVLEKLHGSSARLLRALALLSLLSVALAGWFPGQVQPHVQQKWAPLHWVLGLTSYGLVGAALLHATIWRSTDRRLRGESGGAARLAATLLTPGIPLMRLETLTFRFVTLAFITLTLTLVLGILHASPWRWDHKTVFSILAWLTFALLLGGRVWMGWRGRSAVRWLYAGSALLILAYAGTRFVLEVLLHRLPPSGG